MYFWIFYWISECLPSVKPSQVTRKNNWTEGVSEYCGNNKKKHDAFPSDFASSYQ